jgi:hypothetical protein
MAAERLGTETTHWLKQTIAIDQITLELPLDRLSHNLGHSGLGATCKYVPPERRRQMAAIAQLWGQRKRKWGRSTLLLFNVSKFFAAGFQANPVDALVHLSSTGCAK